MRSGQVPRDLSEKVNNRTFHRSIDSDSSTSQGYDQFMQEGKTSGPGHSPKVRSALNRGIAGGSSSAPDSTSNTSDSIAPLLSLSLALDIHVPRIQQPIILPAATNNINNIIQNNNTKMEQADRIERKNLLASDNTDSGTESESGESSYDEEIFDSSSIASALRNHNFVSSKQEKSHTISGSNSKKEIVFALGHTKLGSISFGGKKEKKNPSKRSNISVPHDQSRVAKAFSSPFPSSPTTPSITLPAAISSPSSPAHISPKHIYSKSSERSSMSHSELSIEKGHTFLKILSPNELDTLYQPRDTLGCILYYISCYFFDTFFMCPCVCTAWNNECHLIIINTYAPIMTHSNLVLRHFTHISELSLFENDQITSDVGLDKFTNLTHLSLESNSRIVDNDIKKLTKLKSLSLKENKLITDVRNFVDLTALDLSLNYKIENSSIEKLTLLKDLSLWGNKTIDNYGIRNLTNLTNLNLCYDTKISKISHLIRIASLNLRGCNLVVDIHNFRNLTSLNLAKNTAITDSILINFAITLTSLNLRENYEITDKSLIQLSYLQNLNLALNKSITNNSLSCLSNLTCLNLWKNENITAKGLTTLKNLRELDLRSNSKIFGFAIWHLTGLQSLDLCRNSNIDNYTVKQLTNLTDLNLAQNTLITDDAISKLSKLIKLDLTKNSLITPLGLSHCVQLKEEDIIGFHPHSLSF